MSSASDEGKSLLRADGHRGSRLCWAIDVGTLLAGEIRAITRKRRIVQASIPIGSRGCELHVSIGTDSEVGSRSGDECVGELHFDVGPTGGFLWNRACRFVVQVGLEAGYAVDEKSWS